MDDLIRYAYAAVALLFVGSALISAAVLCGVWFVLDAFLSGEAGALPWAALALSALIAGYCITGLVLRQLRIT
jgi:hypothetical protein